MQAMPAILYKHSKKNVLLSTVKRNMVPEAAKGPDSSVCTYRDMHR